MGSDIKQAVSRLVASGLAEQLCGSSKEEIEALEAQAARTLPASYRLFLSLLGHGAGEFLEGTDFRIEEVPGLTESAAELLTECGVDFKPPEGWFVFCMHQGYQFLFFDCTEGDDPSVWRYADGGEVEQVFGCFSDWVAHSVDDEIAAFSELHRN